MRLLALATALAFGLSATSVFACGHLVTASSGQKVASTNGATSIYPSTPIKPQSQQNDG